MTPETPETFDASKPYHVSEHVSLRDESFGALAYHHVNRRLVFLKSRELVALVRQLGEFASASDAVATMVNEKDRERYLRTLGSLHASELLRAS